MNPITLLGRYFRTTGQLLFQPARFFRAMPLEGGILLPTVFAVATHWLASALSFLWKMPLGKFIQKGISEWTDVAQDISAIDSPGRHVEALPSVDVLTQFKTTVLPWLWGASSVILDPFFTLATLAFASLIMFVGARTLLTPEKPATLQSVTRILCFASAPVLWTIVPVVGWIVAPLMILSTTTIGIREVYRTSNTRAFFVAVFPKLVLVSFSIAGIAVLGWLALRTLAALFGVTWS